MVANELISRYWHIMQSVLHLSFIKIVEFLVCTPCEVYELHLLTIAGGQSSLADYCTYFVAYSDGSCTDTNSARAPDRMLGEVRGSNSR